MSPDDPTVPNVPDDPARAGAWAAYVALARELDRVLGTTGEARRCADQPLAAVRLALAEADPKLGAALDGLEDVIESQLRASGWPARAVGRGEAA